MKRSTVTEISNFERHLNAKYGKPIHMVAHVIEECVHFLNLDKLTLVLMPFTYASRISCNVYNMQQ